MSEEQYMFQVILVARLLLMGPRWEHQKYIGPHYTATRMSKKQNIFQVILVARLLLIGPRLEHR